MDNQITTIEEQAIAKPETDTKFAHESAKFLMDIVSKNKWAKNFGGEKDHLQYEAWQTAGKYYGYTVKTKDAEFIELGSSIGFKAKAEVINEHTGIVVGGAEAYCLNDEEMWNTEPHLNKWGKQIKGKPKFQLASMAQTRAGSKALRQILGFVVALAGYSPTPVEEMTGNENTNIVTSNQSTQNSSSSKTTQEKVENTNSNSKCELCHTSGKYHKKGCANS